MFKKTLPFIVLILAVFTYWNFVLKNERYRRKENMSSLEGLWQNVVEPTEYVFISGSFGEKYKGFFGVTIWENKPDYDHFSPIKEGTITISDEIEIKYYDCSDSLSKTGNIIIIDDDKLKFPFGEFKRYKYTE